jgi:hypothetical protein
MYNILSIGRANVFVMPCLIWSTSKKVMILLSFWEVGANSSQWGGSVSTSGNTIYLAITNE